MLTPLGDKDPRQIGPYRIQSLLGRGGMGAVYLGFSPEDKAVAVKVPAPALARDEQFRSRFRREVAAARRVHGPAVAAVLDADTAGDRPWMATEYVEGKSLAEAVSDRGQLDDRLLTGLAAGLAEALVAIHDVGVVHRDLKPANIVLAWDGPRVIDFGVASASDTTRHTSTGVLIGTIVWMAPEQLRGERAGPAADVFAWGACVAFAATGHPPFRAPTPEAVGVRILSSAPELTGVPAGLLPVVRAALDKDPARRPTAIELRDRLLRGRAGDGLEGAATERVAASDERYETAMARLWELPPATPEPPAGRRTPSGPPRSAVPRTDARQEYSTPPYARATPPPSYGAPRGYGDSGYRGSGYPAAGSGAAGGRTPPPASRPGRRGAMVALVVVFVLLLGGGLAAAAVTLMNNSSPGSDAASTGSPNDAGTGSAAAGGPAGPASQLSPTTGPTTARRLTAQDVRARVKSLGYTAELSSFDAKRALNVVIGSKTVAGGNSDGSDARLEQAFVFTDTDYLGTDTSQPSRQIRVVATTKSYAVLEYGTFAAADPDCCPTGTARVRFNWDGKSFTPQDPAAIPPADPKVDGSRR
ncbi:protein kinase [Pseudofrankia sp. DC12]|uniref:protein kinase domain-containing protein n=1 Tax=Pseudofrankia sp. DC12 TaxID=683315 RepID=UPI0005F7FD04|nr:protein kinase [Pseudofrankia sp. DC12]